MKLTLIRVLTAASLIAMSTSAHAGVLWLILAGGTH
jgi:hypothetical protein